MKKSVKDNLSFVIVGAILVGLLLYPHMKTMTGFVISASDIIADLKFDEGSGINATDSSGNGKNATIYGANYTSGLLSYALNFDGVNDYLDFRSIDNSLKGLTQFSVSVWAYHRNLSIANANNDWIIGQHQPGRGISIGMANTKIFFNLKTTTANNSWGTECSAWLASYNEWVYLVLSWDGSVLHGYVNGEEWCTSNINGTFSTDALSHDNNSPMYIGMNYIAAGPNEYFNGTLDDLTFYNRVLTATEVMNEYNTVMCNDTDSDGYKVGGETCGTIDCNDNNAAISPGLTEVCGNAVDENCNNFIADCYNPGPSASQVIVCNDNDYDGYKTGGSSCGIADCNDANSAIRPNATEVCGNGIDENCDGSDVPCTCTDSDNGLDYYTKGTLVQTNLTSNLTDKCDTRNASRLIEYTCTPNAQGNPYQFYTCPGGCNNGICVCLNDSDCSIGYACSNGTCIKKPGNCTDSDGGLNYYVKGTIMPNASTDRCDSTIPGRLVEYSCNLSSYGNPYYFYTCPFGCRDGACISNQTNICIDNDHDNFDACGSNGNSTIGCDSPCDCNDNNATIRPNATEICGDGIDQNCNGVDSSCPKKKASMSYNVCRNTYALGLHPFIGPRGSSGCNSSLCGSDDYVRCERRIAGIGAISRTWYREVCARSYTTECSIAPVCNSGDVLIATNPCLFELCNGLDDDNNGEIDDGIVCNSAVISDTGELTVTTNKTSYYVGEQVGLK